MKGGSVNPSLHVICTGDGGKPQNCGELSASYLEQLLEPFLNVVR